MLPTIGFGTYRVTDQTVIEKAIKNGYNHFDTAELYKNEHIVRQSIEKFGTGKIYITTKISKKSILDNKIEDSFNERLKIFPYIDLLLLHIPSKDCKKDWDILSKLYLQHKDNIGKIGVSNYDICHLQQIETCELKPYCNQIELSPFYIRTELVNYLRLHKIHIVSHTTLTRSEKFDNECLKVLSKKYNVSVANIMLQWALHHGYTIIPKTCSEEHMIENSKTEVQLAQSDIEILNSLNENFYITKVII